MESFAKFETVECDQAATSGYNPSFGFCIFYLFEKCFFNLFKLFCISNLLKLFCVFLFHQFGTFLVCLNFVNFESLEWGQPATIYQYTGFGRSLIFEQSQIQNWSQIQNKSIFSIMKFPCYENCRRNLLCENKWKSHKSHEMALKCTFESSASNAIWSRGGQG